MTGRSAGWLRDTAAVPAGNIQPIRVPHELQDSLLQYYLETTDHMREAAAGGGDTSVDRAGSGGAKDAGVGGEGGGDGGDGGAGRTGGNCGHSNELNDDDSLPASNVPHTMAPQVGAEDGDALYAARRRIRTTGVEVALRHLIEGQIMSSLGIGASDWDGLHSLYSTTVALVVGGAAVAIIQGFEVSVVWASRRMGRVLLLCSCGGDRSTTCVETLHQTAKKFTWAHADAMRLAVEGVARQTGRASMLLLFSAFPVLLSEKEETAPPDVQCVRVLRNNREVWAVHAQSVWCALVQPVKSATNQAPRCKNVICRSHRRCLHALAFFKHKMGLGEEQEADSTSEKEYDGNGVAFEQPNKEDEGVLQEEIEDDKATIRRSRNVLPCKEEVRIGVISDSYGRAGQDSPTGMGALPAIFHERRCMRCGSARGTLPLKTTEAVLYTMGGRVAVRTGSWTCSGCGKDVMYDGADSGLFAWSSETIYTRVYVDVVLHMVLTSRSSTSAAAAAMAFFQHVTAALPPATAGQAGQVLNAATASYSETLIVPSCLYACSRCLSLGHMCLYETLVADGQALGFFRNKAVPLLRRMVDNPVVDVLISVGSVVKSVAVRGIIRRRCAARISISSAVTAAERRAYDAFVLAANPPRGPRVCDDKDIGAPCAEWAAWAASYLFCTFFTCVDSEDTSNAGDRGSDSDADVASSSASSDSSTMAAAEESLTKD